MNREEQELSAALKGRRILVVEDNYLIALMIRRLLVDWGCEVVGPLASLDEAAAAVEHEPLDGAILDINILGGSSAPIALKLQARGTPFFFVTGYGSPKGLPAALARVERLNKPISVGALEVTVRKAFALS